MKILVITARYPPYHFGGYGIRVKNIIDELHRRGHKLLVITSIKETNQKIENDLSSYRVLRKLHLGYKISRSKINKTNIPGKLCLLFNNNGKQDRLQKQPQKRNSFLQNLAIFIRNLLFDFIDLKLIDTQIKNLHPDIIYLGHITSMSKAIMPYFSTCKIPIVYDEGGSGLIDSWLERGTWYIFIEKYTPPFRILKNLKSSLIKAICGMSGNLLKSQWAWPDNISIIFNSQLNMNNAISRNVPIKEAQVIHSGIETEKFVFRPRTNFGIPLFIIVPGRIEPRKGQLDAVRLLLQLFEVGIESKIIFAGEKWSEAYYSEIYDEIESNQLEERITFLPMVPQETLIDLYHMADICFFPSYQKVGYSRVPLEAMACGCVVISYGNEGSNEIILDRYTGFIVVPGDISEITTIIREMNANPDIVSKITNAARKEIEENCSMPKYIDRIEGIILSVVGANLPL